MERIKKITANIWPLFLYLALSIFAVIPFFNKGFFQIHDDVQVARIFEMAKSLSQGIFPVRWVADLGYGVGYPIFNFYSVLPYYIGGFIVSLGIDSLLSTKAVFVFGIILSGVSMYFLAKNYFGKIAGLVSAVVYLYFPYHAVNVYVRGDLAEVFAYIFLPTAFLSIFKIHDSKKFLKRYIVLGALSFFAVIISHNLSALMLFIFTGIFICYSVVSAENKKLVILSYGILLLLAFLLSAFYSVPAAVESKYTNVMTQIGGGSDYHDHFICFSQLWESTWGYGGSAPGCLDGVSFRLGKLNVIISLIAVFIGIISFKTLKEKKVLVFSSIFFAVFSIFLTNALSLFLWNLPLMKFLQFPWRFLNFTGVFLSILAGFLTWYVLQKFSMKIGAITAVLIIGITIIMNGKLFSPQEILGRNASYYTSESYLNWTASKISDEYLPKGFKSPSSPYLVEESFARIRLNDNSFYHLDKKKLQFEVKETVLERLSEALTVIGVIALTLVIIIKPKKLYGKKAS